MSAAHKIDRHIVDKITLMAYQLSPNPCATLIKDYIDEANDELLIPFDDFLDRNFLQCDVDGNLHLDYYEWGDVDGSPYYIDADSNYDDPIVYDVEYIEDNQYEDYKIETLNVPFIEKVPLTPSNYRRAWEETSFLKKYPGHTP